MAAVPAGGYYDDGGAGGGGAGDEGRQDTFWYPDVMQFVYMLNLLRVLSVERVDAELSAAADLKTHRINDDKTVVWVASKGDIVYIKAVTLDYRGGHTMSGSIQGCMPRKDYCPLCIIGGCPVHGCGVEGCPYMQGCGKHWCQKHRVRLKMKTMKFVRCRCTYAYGCTCQIRRRGTHTKKYACPECFCPVRNCEQLKDDCAEHRCAIPDCDETAVAEWNRDCVWRCTRHMNCIKCGTRMAYYEDTSPPYPEDVQVLCDTCKCKNYFCKLSWDKCHEHMCPCGKLAIHGSTPRRCKEHMTCPVLVRCQKTKSSRGGAGGGKKKYVFRPCGLLTVGRTLACSEGHLCRRCKVRPIFKTSPDDRADFLRKLRYCKECLYKRGFFSCSVGGAHHNRLHGSDNVARLHLPFTGAIVRLINEFLPFGNGASEATICIGVGRMAKSRDVSLGNAFRCSLLCRQCCVAWAATFDDGGWLLRRIAARDSLATDALGILTTRETFDADDDGL